MIGLASCRVKKSSGPKPKVNPANFFKTPRLLVFTGAPFFVFMGIYGPAFYIGIYAREQGISSASMAFYLVAILQAGSIAGRVLAAFVADRIGALNLATIVCACAGILTFCWMGIENEPGLIVWAVLFGMFFGAYLGLQPPAFMSALKGDMRFLASYMGICLLLASPGILIGSPISGAILRSEAGWTGLQAFSGCMIMLGAIFMAASRVLTVGWGVVKV